MAENMLQNQARYTLKISDTDADDPEAEISDTLPF